MAEQSTPPSPNPSFPWTRRDLLKAGAALSATAFLGGCAAPGRRGAFGAERKPEHLRIGVIGCGGRGTGAAVNALSADENVSIVALGDLFEDRVQGARRALAEREERPQIIDDAHCFVGWDAYLGVANCDDVDVVIHGTPPGFRPRHIRAVIEAGKHLFTEKPVAVDPVGIRVILEAAELAAQKNLAFVAGTQRRHDPAYQEIIRRIHRGDIGEVVAGQCYWLQGGLWYHERQPEWTDMEWQVRNWLYFDWLSGDHIVEQHIHNIDVINWVMGGPPELARASGGRQVRTDPRYGNVFDHFSVDFVYPGGVHVTSMCRQIPGASDLVAEYVTGTKGSAEPARWIENRRRRFEYAPPNGEWVNPYVQEHADLLASIRAGRPINEGRQVAESNLTAIMGRMAAYTGRELSWEWLLNDSKLDLSPPEYAFGELPVGPTPVPGETPLV